MQVLRLILCGFLVVCVHLCAAAGKRMKRVNINRREMCDGCKITFDQYIAAVKTDAEAKKRQRMDPKTTEINGNRLAEELCNQSPFTDKLTPNIRFACMKVTQDYQAELLSLFSGKHVNVFMDRSQSDVFKRKQQVRVPHHDSEQRKLHMREIR